MTMIEWLCTPSKPPRRTEDAGQRYSLEDVIQPNVNEPLHHMFPRELFLVLDVALAETIGEHISSLGQAPSASYLAAWETYKTEVRAIFQAYIADYRQAKGDDLTDEEDAVLSNILAKLDWMWSPHMPYEGTHCYYYLWPLLTPGLFMTVHGMISANQLAWREV